MAARTALPTGLHRTGARQGGREDAIHGCWDQSEHAALRARLPRCTTPRRRWVHAEGVAVGHAPPPEAGTPQGGVVSPLLAPMAGEGRARLVDGAEPRGHPPRPAWQTGQHKGRSLLRYADALVGVAPAREGLAQPLRPPLAAFLRGSGRQRRDATPRLGQRTAGLNVVGCERTRDTRALVTPPQQAKVYGPSRTMKTSRKQPQPRPAAQSIRGLHPHMRGWANYDQPCAAKRAFRKMDHLV